VGGGVPWSLFVPVALRDALVLLALLLVTLAFAWAQRGLEVDIENRSLKSPASSETLALARRVEQFGPDVTVVAAFRAVPDGVGTLTRVELDSLEVLRKGLLAEPAIARIQPWPSRSDSSAVWAIDLAAPGGDFAPSVESLERLLAARTPPTLRSSLSGLAVGEVVIAREVRAEQSRVLPLVVAGFVLLLLVYYRNFGLVLAILAPAGVAILWTSGRVCAARA
jgi:predicted RND superfamily exporter protein